MTLPKSYPESKIPMYIVTLVESNGTIVDSSYRTRAEVIEFSIINECGLITDEDDNFITQSFVLDTGVIVVITTIYIQISNHE